MEKSQDVKSRLYHRFTFSKPPPAIKLPQPPKEWIQCIESRVKHFCKECENVFYVEDDNGNTRQFFSDCKCDL